MKLLFAVLLLVGAAQFALANSIVSELLPSDVDIELFEGSVFGSMHGSFGLVGAIGFGVVVGLRLKRSGR